MPPMMTPAPRTFRVIGYATDAIVPQIIQYGMLTHINFAFLVPKADGTFQPLNNAWKLQQIVDLAHQKGVKVLISVGGWGWDSQFEALAATSQTRQAFVDGVVKIVDQYQLDGVDIDWEYPDPGASSQNFLLLMKALRAALPQGKLLSAAVVAVGDHAAGIPDALFSLVGYVNIMAYDGEGANHASMQYAQDALDYWLGRGLPQDKAVLGVPFYSRPDGTAYAKLVQDDPAAANEDFFNYYGKKVNYNGIPTMQQKTKLALERASGIMIWVLDDDASGRYSLLNAIHQAITDSTGKGS